MDFIGTLFSRNEQGGVAQRLMGGASKKRCNYFADKTSHILMHSCLDDAISSGVKFLIDHELLDIGVVDGKCEGVVLRDIQSGGIYPVLCKALAIATGDTQGYFIIELQLLLLPQEMVWQLLLEQDLVLKILR